MKRIYGMTIAASLGALFAAGAVLVAGPLNPPAGPVAPTHKTLTEVEPRIAVSTTNTPGDSDATPSQFKITQAGSYYLTGNIAGVSGRIGIEIAAGGVTLDLNGFELLGTTGTLQGVFVTVPGLSDIAVINGSVRNWGLDGINLGSFVATNGRVERVLATGNGASGIRVGMHSVVRDCAASANATDGISTSSGCSVVSCSASANVRDGFVVGTGAIVRDCIASDNTDNGIDAANATTIDSCTAYINTGNGIDTGTGCTVVNCTSYNNQQSGISVAAGTAVNDCTARLNTLDGIRCTGDCTVRGNTCSGNGSGTGDGAGVHALGSDNRIESNHCTGADRGVDVDASGNVIIRNTCAGNTTNWSIIGNNYYGPIINRIGQLTAAVNGNEAGNALGTVDPHANFTY